MNRAQPIKVRHGRKPGELVIALPSAWELRLRRVLRELLAESLPDPRAVGLTLAQREARRRLRQRHVREAICHFVSELITADIVGKEIALATRGRAGRRAGSLREHVAAILREAAGH